MQKNGTIVEHSAHQAHSLKSINQYECATTTSANDARASGVHAAVLRGLLCSSASCSSCCCRHQRNASAGHRRRTRTGRCRITTGKYTSPRTIFLSPVLSIATHTHTTRASSKSLTATVHSFTYRRARRPKQLLLGKRNGWRTMLKWRK